MVHRRVRAIALRTNSTISRLAAARSQSKWLSSLSWQYALLLPRWVRRNSSPPRSIGVPAENNNRHRWFLVSCCLSRFTPSSSVSPSAPQFQELLLSLPSRLSSRLASLCLPLYETRSHSVNPSWQVTKLTLL